MKTFTQVEQQTYTYEVPYRYVSPYDRDTRVDPEVLASLLLGVVVGVTLWVWMMWRLTSKAGYRGGVRWVWFVFLGFPLTTGWTMLAFILLPWPVQRELKRSQANQLQSAVDQELEQLRQQL